MATLKNTIRHHVRMKMIKKTVLLILLAAALAFLSYAASTKAIVTGSENYRLLYSIGSVVISVAVFLFVAFKIRYFQTLFSRDWTGNIIKTENFEMGVRWKKDDIRSSNDFIITILLDHNNRKKKLRFPINKISGSVYSVGDKVYMIKGTRYPINLTREAEQHICPMCARNSCYGDFCPDCNLKY